MSAFAVPTLKTVNFAEESALETISNGAFQNSGIESIVLPDTLKIIGAQAFMNCQSLQSVSLPKTIESVADDAFASSTAFLESGELIVRDWCGAPEALKDKSFTSIVKPALEHSFTTYSVAAPAEGEEAPEGLVLHRACAVCGELDPDAQDVSVDDLLAQTAGEAAAEVAKAACDAVDGVDYDGDKTPEENVAAAKAAAEQAATKAAQDQAAIDQEAAVAAAVKEAQDQATNDKDAAVKAAQEQAAKDKDAAVKAAQASGVKANTMTVKAKTISAKATKKTTAKKAKAFTVENAKGKVTFYKISGNAKIKVSKAGKVTVQKGLKAKKTYKVKVLVCAAGNKSYAPAYKTVTLKVQVK